MCSMFYEAHIAVYTREDGVFDINPVWPYIQERAVFVISATYGHKHTGEVGFTVIIYKCSPAFIYIYLPLIYFESSSKSPKKY